MKELFQDRTGRVYQNIGGARSGWLFFSLKYAG
jgi:hypothetical protein